MSETDPLALSRKRPDLSASVPLTPVQKMLLLLGAVAVMILTVLMPWALAKAFVLLSTVFYLLFTFYKFILVRFSISGDAEINISAEELSALKDEDLPVYSILVPMYRESESAGQMIEALKALDYPAEKKDIQLLLEEDDAETREAVARLEIPSGFRITVVPVSFPRTKPKACNVGLAYAKGKYTVIYDAEDRPETDQLKKAVAAFNRVAADVVCLQCRLNFYNPRQNLLTRWFTAEYSAWFDLSLPGLCAVGAVIPLGGTSNHFLTAELFELMGWDAYNVTEDCDLGVRIYRAGFKSRMLCTTTWEEACSSPSFWIKQRTRWLKGYMQTYLVHMRNPYKLLSELGLMNFLHFQLLIGGIVFSFLINPLFWLVALMWFLTRMDVLTSLFPQSVFAMGAFCLFAGNFGFLYVGAVACYRRGYYDLVKFALLMPFYWMMMSVSGWRAFLQFFSSPFLWEKTKHGLNKKTEKSAPFAIFGVCLALVLTAGFTLLGIVHCDRVSSETDVYEGVCRQFVANTTEGRQALVCSAEWPPLPFLVRLPFAFLFKIDGVPVASLIACALFGALCVVLADRIFRRWKLGWFRYLIVASLALCPGFIAGCSDGSASTLILFLVLTAVYGLIDWLASGQAKALVYLSLALSLLIVTSTALLPWIALVMAILLASAFARRSEGAHKGAILLLGFLPAFYAAGLWMLMNWLIMGNGLYFLEPLRGRRLEWITPQALFCVCPLALVCFGFLVRTVRQKAAALLQIAAFIAAGIAAAVCFHVWPEINAERNHISQGAVDAKQAAQIEHHVLARSRYPKVFVVGFNSLRLLGPEPNPMFMPVFDFNFNRAKDEYHGQDLFILVHRPDAGRAVSTGRSRYERLYFSGSGSTLYDADFGPWRLFEIVQAPK